MGGGARGEARDRGCNKRGRTCVLCVGEREREWALRACAMHARPTPTSYVEKYRHEAGAEPSSVTPNPRYSPRTPSALRRRSVPRRPPPGPPRAPPLACARDGRQTHRSAPRSAARMPRCGGAVCTLRSGGRGGAAVTRAALRQHTVRLPHTCSRVLMVSSGWHGTRAIMPDVAEPCVTRRGCERVTPPQTPRRPRPQLLPPAHQHRCIPHIVRAGLHRAQMLTVRQPPLRAHSTLTSMDIETVT